MSGVLQVLDEVTKTPSPLQGVNGKIITSRPANAKVITANDDTVYDPPIEVWIGDNGAVTVTVVPYGIKGDSSVQYPLAAGMGGTILPVMCKQVKATGTTAGTIIGHW